MAVLFVYVTFESQEQARHIAKQMVEGRLAACANIFPAHWSIYRWEDKVQEAGEVAAIYKTTQERFEDLKQAILKVHSFECPCIVALSVEKGHPAFLAWVEGQVEVL